jgi:hypothetical protein
MTERLPHCAYWLVLPDMKAPRTSNEMKIETVINSLYYAIKHADYSFVNASSAQQSRTLLCKQLIEVTAPRQGLAALVGTPARELHSAGVAQAQRKVMGIVGGHWWDAA